MIEIVKILDQGFFVELILDIVFVYVGNYVVLVSDFLNLIVEVFSVLLNIFLFVFVVVVVEKLKLVVLVCCLVQDDQIMCLECGGFFKLLKCYLMMYYNLMFEQYCEKWDLVVDYLMVVLVYVQVCLCFVKEMGFGQSCKGCGC